MSSDEPVEAQGSAQSDEPTRRRGDRRQVDVPVATDRRKGNRRTTPGLGALLSALLRRTPR